MKARCSFPPAQGLSFPPFVDPVAPLLGSCRRPASFTLVFEQAANRFLPPESVLTGRPGISPMHQTSGITKNLYASCCANPGREQPCSHFTDERTKTQEGDDTVSKRSSVQPRPTTFQPPLDAHGFLWEGGFSQERALALAPLLAPVLAVWLRAGQLLTSSLHLGAGGSFADLSSFPPPLAAPSARRSRREGAGPDTDPSGSWNTDHRRLWQEVNFQSCVT